MDFLDENAACNQVDQYIDAADALLGCVILVSQVTIGRSLN